MRTRRIYSQPLSCITYNSANYIHHVVHSIPGTYLSYSWKSVPFDRLPPIPLLHPSTSVAILSQRLKSHRWPAAALGAWRPAEDWGPGPASADLTAVCLTRLGALWGSRQGGRVPVAVRILPGRTRKMENLPEGLSLSRDVMWGVPGVEAGPLN